MNKRKQIIVDTMLNMDYSILQENDVCPRGELLTDKELERMKLHNPKRDWPKTAEAKVYAESCYISFGVRFGRVKQYLNTGK